MCLSLFEHRVQKGKCRATNATHANIIYCITNGDIMGIMSMHTQVKDDVKEALKAREATRLSAARNLLAAFTNELVARGKKPDGELSDDDAVAVVRRLAKQRRESIEQFEKGGRPELAEKERAELAYLEHYLPQMMPREEIRAAVEKKKMELGISDSSQIGQLIGAVMTELKGKADGKDVKEIAEKSLLA